MPVEDDVRGFYDGFARDYDLAYAGHWPAAVQRQGAALDAVIQAALPGATSVLDCSCGIGTQAIGLARAGYRVMATDISPGEVERARVEAARVGADVAFDVADFRDLTGIDGLYDVVISCDNAIPHLLADDEVRVALAQMRAKLRPSGLLIVTMRDFDAALLDRPPATAPILVDGPPRQVLVRLHDWDPDAPCYTVRYLVLTEGAAGWDVVEHTARYRAITRDELSLAAVHAGFTDVHWPADVVIVGGQRTMLANNP